MTKCWICGDGPEPGKEGFSATPMTLPGFVRPVLVCGNCIIRALQITEKKGAKR